MEQRENSLLVQMSRVLEQAEKEIKPLATGSVIAPSLALIGACIGKVSGLEKHPWMARLCENHAEQELLLVGTQLREFLLGPYGAKVILAFDSAYDCSTWLEEDKVEK